MFVYFSLFAVALISTVDACTHLDFTCCYNYNNLVVLVLRTIPAMRHELRRRLVTAALGLRVLGVVRVRSMEI